jgi:hypothetical protein
MRINKQKAQQILAKSLYIKQKIASYKIAKMANYNKNIANALLNEQRRNLELAEQLNFEIEKNNAIQNANFSQHEPEPEAEPEAEPEPEPEAEPEPEPEAEPEPEPVIEEPIVSKKNIVGLLKSVKTLDKTESVPAPTPKKPLQNIFKNLKFVNKQIEASAPVPSIDLVITEKKTNKNLVNMLKNLKSSN